MKLTEEALTEIVAKSSTFDERLANGYFVSHPDQPEVSRRLDRWCEVVAKGDRQKFQRLLELRTLDADSIKRGLAPVRLSTQAELPAWTELLQDCVNTAAHRQPESLRFLDAGEPWPFEQIVAPFVLVASDQLTRQESSRLRSADSEGSTQTGAKPPLLVGERLWICPDVGVFNFPAAATAVARQAYRSTPAR